MFQPYTLTPDENIELQFLGGSELQVPSGFRREQKFKTTFETGNILGAAALQLEKGQASARDKLNNEEELAPEELQALYPGPFQFEKAMTPSVAQLMQDRKTKEQERLAIIDRGFQQSDNPFLTGTTDFLQDVVASLDPTVFIPWVGAAKSAAYAAKFGKLGGRLATGAAEGFIGTSVVEPFLLASNQDFQFDYDAADSMMNITMGAVAGSGLHAIGGFVGDAIGVNRISPRAHELALRKAIADVNEMGTVDVDPIIKLDAMNKTESKLSLRSVKKEELFSGKTFLADVLTEEELSNISYKEAKSLQEELRTSETFNREVDNLSPELREVALAEKKAIVENRLGRKASTDPIESRISQATSDIITELDQVDARIQALKEQRTNLKETGLSGKGLKETRAQLSRDIKKLNNAAKNLVKEADIKRKQVLEEFNSDSPVDTLSRKDFTEQFFATKRQVDSNPRLNKLDLNEEIPRTIPANERRIAERYREFLNATELTDAEVSRVLKGDRDYVDELYKDIQHDKQFSRDTQEQSLNDLKESLSERQGSEARDTVEKLAVEREAEIEEVLKNDFDIESIEAVDRAVEELKQESSVIESKEVEALIEQDVEFKQDLEDVASAKEDLVKCYLGIV